MKLDTLPSAKFKTSLEMLMEAANYAAKTSGDPWEFAIEIQRLRELGLSDNDLRFLVRLNYIEHASEIRGSATQGRKFKSAGELQFTFRTCFVLTPSGMTACRSVLAGASATEQNGLATKRSGHPSGDNRNSCQPNWDAKQRVLYFNGFIVKRFKWHSPNQETVLSVFEEEGWPVRIDDPLIPSRSLEVERRLNDTIKCLNRKQQNKLVNFHGDGTGHGVIWEAAL